MDVFGTRKNHCGTCIHILPPMICIPSPNDAGHTPGLRTYAPGSQGAGKGGSAHAFSRGAGAGGFVTLWGCWPGWKTCQRMLFPKDWSSYSRAVSGRMEFLRHTEHPCSRSYIVCSRCNSRQYRSNCMDQLCFQLRG